MKSVWAVSVIATILLCGTIAASVSIQDADAAKSSKPREIVVVGSKVKEVVRSEKIESCIFTLHTDRTTTTETVLASPGGVVKLSNVSSDVETVDVQCDFKDGSSGEPIDGVDLKERGTTVIHYFCDCVDPER